MKKLCIQELQELLNKGSSRNFPPNIKQFPKN